MPATNHHELSRTTSQARAMASSYAMPAGPVAQTSRYPTFFHWALIVACWLAAAAALTIDMSVARFWKTHKTPAYLVDLLESAETFGNGAGVLLLLVSALVLGAIPVRAVLRLTLASLGAGLVADLFKLMIARTRPRDLTVQQGVLETFGDWFSPTMAPTAMHSFPSAHVATAMGLAFALSCYYPRGRYVFWGLVVLVLLQRLQTGAHFVSDTLAGAAIGLGPALVLFSVGPIAGWFARFERPSVSRWTERGALRAPHIG